MQDPVKTEQQKDQQSERDIQDRLGKLPLVSAEIAKVIIGQEQIVEELYLLVYARFPDRDEREFGSRLFEAATDQSGRKQAAEDLLWALLNTPEFLFKD